MVANDDLGIGTRTLRGILWAYGSYVGGKLLVLISIAILARLLSPEDFGLVAFALIITVFLDTISDLGLSQALIIVSEEEVDDKADTAWTGGVALSLVMMTITAALGPAAASFFNEPALTVMLPVLSLNFPLRALGLVHQAMLQKQLDFRTGTIVQMADVLTRGSVGIALAVAGAGAYSLVGGYLAGSAAMTLALWAVVPWRPSPRLNRGDLRGLLRFGGGVTVLAIISAFMANVDYVAVGRVLGTTELGLYTLGWRLPELLIINLSVVAGLVLFPSFASIERPALAAAYLSALGYMLMVSMPMAIGLCVLAEPLVLTTFGGQWIDSIAAMQVLTLFAFAVTVAIPGGIVYKSIGRVDVLIKIAIPAALLGIVSIVIFVEDGIVAVAACQAASATLVALLNTTLASRLLGTGWRRTWAAVAPSVVAGAVLAAVLVAVATLIEDPYATLAAAVPVGAVAYLGTLWLVAPEALMRLWRTALNRGPQPAKAPS